ATAYEKAQGIQETLQLIDYLGHHPWLGNHPEDGGRPLPAEEVNQLIRHHLAQGTAVGMLDGMDEVTASSLRDEVARATARSSEAWALGRGRPVEPRPAGGIFALGVPGQEGGNQVVIPSRIAGYHSSPIRGDLTHVTIEPMGRLAVERFCEQWVLA